MHTLGHHFVRPGIHAGGLRYHGESPLVSQLVHEGACRGSGHPQTETFGAGVTFARNEGIVPAPESSHAIAAALREARPCAQSGKPKTLLINLSGHSQFDKQTPEPVFGSIKSALGFRQFLLRGLPSVRGEWNLAAMSWNIKRMFALQPV